MIRYQTLLNDINAALKPIIEKYRSEMDPETLKHLENGTFNEWQALDRTVCQAMDREWEAGKKPS